MTPGGSVRTSVDRPQHARHERLARGRVVADRQRLPRPAEQHLLMGDEPREPDRVDRDVAAHALGRRARSARRRVELRVGMQLDDLRRAEDTGRLLREAHHQERATREVRDDETRDTRALGGRDEQVVVEAGRADDERHARVERRLRVAEERVGAGEVDCDVASGRAGRPPVHHLVARLLETRSENGSDLARDTEQADPHVTPPRAPGSPVRSPSGTSSRAVRSPRPRARRDRRAPPPPRRPPRARPP